MHAFDESLVTRTPVGRFAARANSQPEAALVAPVDVEVLASIYHEEWRGGRLSTDGTFEPREKVTTDAEWISQRGTDRVDIANTMFAELPDDWRAENEAAARVVAGYLRDNQVDLNDPASRSDAGQYVHEAWLSRNAWAAGGELDVHFDELPLDEQEKDVRQIRLAL